MEIIDRIRATPWSRYAQPEWNTSSSVADALINVSMAKDATSGSSAYNQLLYAIGNNHAGTYYPVLLPAMAFLSEMLCNGSPQTKTTVLSMLDDLIASFHPEPGHEEMEPMFLTESRKLGPVLEELAAGNGLVSGTAKELLITLNTGVD
jgi:hypothetical protein